MIDTIRAKARELLSSGEIKCFIGYEEGTRGRVRPAFVYDAEDAERLIWDQRCTYNLTVYLHQFQRPSSWGVAPPRVGITVKPCDSHSLNVLFQEVFCTLEKLSGDDHGRRGAVTDFIVLGLCDLHHHLGGRMLDVHLLQDGHSIVGDDHISDGVNEHLVHTLGSKSGPYCTGHRFRGGDVHALGVTPAGP